MVADVIIVAVVVALLVVAIRYLLVSNRNGCSDCSSSGSCAAAFTGRCSVADDMVRRADEALGKAPQAPQPTRR